MRVEFFRCSGCELGCASAKLDISLPGGLLEDLFALIDADGVSQAITVSSPHVVHADRGNGLDARVDLGGTDHETPAAADSDSANALGINAGLSAQIVDSGAEVF